MTTGKLPRLEAAGLTSLRGMDVRTCNLLRVLPGKCEARCPAVCLGVLGHATYVETVLLEVCMPNLREVGFQPVRAGTM